MPVRPEDRGRYPADWALRSRFVRFVRGRGRCEWCGAAHGAPHPVSGSLVVLTCAHVHDDAPARWRRRRERALLASGQLPLGL